jgi:hypothetical protein
MSAKLIRGLSFICRHQFTWPRCDDMGGNYQVCVHCGAMYSYDWSTMRRTAPLTKLPNKASGKRSSHSKGETKKSWTPRERRLRHQVPVQFRERGSAEWMEGTSENISRSGLLLSSSTPLEIGSKMVLTLQMPAELTGDKSAQVICEATLVRVEAVPSPRRAKQTSFRMACAITDYKFVPAAG